MTTLILIVSVLHIAIFLLLFFSIIGTVFPCLQDGIMWFFITLLWPISFIIAYLIPTNNKPASNDTDKHRFREERNSV